MTDDGPAVPREPLDLRLAGPAAAAWLAGLVLLGTPARTGLVVAALAVAAVPAVLVVARHTSVRRLRPAAARFTGVAVTTLLAGAAAAACTALHVAVLTSGPLPGLAARQAFVSAEVVATADPVVSRKPAPAWADGPLLTLAADLRVLDDGRSGSRSRQPVLLLVRGDRWRDVVPGQRLAVRGSLQPPLDRGTYAAVLLVRGDPHRLGRPPPVQRAAASLRAGLRASVADLPPDERGLVPGLVVGDTSGLSDELDADFRRTGLTHLLAVSGANLAIAVGVVLGAGRRAGLPVRVLPVVAAAALAGFVVLARPEPSVLRAAVMGAVALVALATGRPRRGLPALFAAVLVLVLVAPALARSYGFALSALATFGLLALAPGWRDRLVAAGWPRFAAEAVAVPAAAQAICGPVIVLLSSSVSLVGVVANLAAAPAVAPVTVLGVVATVVHPVCPPLARLLGWCTFPPAWWLVHVARWCSAVPGAAISWPEGVRGALLLAALTVAVVVLAPYRPVRRLAAVVVAGVLLAGGTLHVVAPGWPPAGWRFVACDVGQGDGLVLAAGPSTAVVVDTGPDPALMRGCLDRLGVRRVPLVLLTHLHADHVTGLPAVLDGRAVGPIVAGPRETPVAGWRLVTADAGTAHVRLSHGTAGTTWRVGPLTLTSLWPPPGTPSGVRVGGGTDDAENSVENNDSLVVRAVWPGLTVLLTGDVEPEGQRALLAAGADLRADVLKVPHHGSAHQDPAFLAATHARAAVISVGAGNDYGHPAPATVAALAGDGMQVHRTDREGDVAVCVPAPGRLTVAVRGARTPARP